MINLCPPGSPITARKALKNVLQSLLVFRSFGCCEVGARVDLGV
jgi:hypothetical protein